MYIIIIFAYSNNKQNIRPIANIFDTEKSYFEYFPLYNSYIFVNISYSY